MIWAAGVNTETGQGFLADNHGGRFDFDLDADTIEGLRLALAELLEDDE